MKRFRQLSNIVYYRQRRDNRSFKGIWQTRLRIILTSNRHVIKGNRLYHLDRA